MANTSAEAFASNTAQNDTTPNGKTAPPPLIRLDRVYESLRYGEYDFKYGLAEFGDNSQESGAQNIWFSIETLKQKKENGKSIDVVGEVSVTDDGDGMNAEKLQRCLVLGETLREPKPNGQKGIGRFGVGMTMAAISLAKRVEVYSRTSPDAPFQYVYIDLDEVSSGDMMAVPDPMEKEPPVKHVEKLEGSSGTIVVLKKCDRLQTDPGANSNWISADDQVQGLTVFLGRTYRKFIQAGLKMWLNDMKVYLHDPLYMLGPTYFDEKNPSGPEPKAKQFGRTVTIPLEIPESDGETAEVTVKMSLLPKEWRHKKGAGGSKFARRRNIPDNEGISVLRANREVLYGKVPYLIGQFGQSKYKRRDRFWGCEISFPPELDDYFHVRFIKRGAEPVKSLRDKIRDEITKAVRTLRERIKDDWEKTEEAEAEEKGAYYEAEEAMAKADGKLPGSTSGKRGQKASSSSGNEDENSSTQEELLEEIAAEDADNNTEGLSDEERQKKIGERKKELESKPYSIVPVKYPASVFFEPVYLPGKIIIRLNVKHPFYEEVFAPLCGDLKMFDEDSDILAAASTPQQRKARKAMLLLLMSHAKAESQFADNEKIFENLRSQWGMTLSAALTE